MSHLTDPGTVGFSGLRQDQLEPLKCLPRSFYGSIRLCYEAGRLVRVETVESTLVRQERMEKLKAE